MKTVFKTCSGLNILAGQKMLALVDFKTHSYQLLQAFIVFMCKNLPKTFTVVKQSAKKHKVFLPRINNIRMVSTYAA